LCIAQTEAFCANSIGKEQEGKVLMAANTTDKQVMVGEHLSGQDAQPMVQFLGCIENNDFPFEHFKKDFLGE
jgi:hypothetical protein